MNTLEVFYTGKFFEIPKYQRDFEWEISNIDDLFEDILEAMELKVGHYIGTFILSRTKELYYYKIVDGQQRLTTLTMILNCMIEKLDSNNDKIINRDKFIKSNSIWKLKLLGDNHKFFKQLLEGQTVTPNNKSQRLLLAAYNHIELRAQQIKNNNKEKEFIDVTKRLEVMEFVESNEGKAIRIFQTVNDRGKPLSNIDKAKSLLIYYSNRFLNGKLDSAINDNFGNIYRYYDRIKEIADNYDIDLIKQKNFTEDSIMRYHFLAFPNEMKDFDATANYVLNVFLKNTLKSKKSTQSELESFIKEYVDDLTLFFMNLLTIVDKVKSNKYYYKLFSILGVSARLYPLIIRLQMKGILEQNINNKNMTYLDLIEIADVRVYKTRGTDPAKDVSYLASDSKTINNDEIENRLFNFIRHFMHDTEFRSRLEGDVYGNVALKHIFIEYDEYILRNTNHPNYTIQDLIDLNNTTPTIEHVFAQEVRFNFPSRGFSSEEEYISSINKIGNLTILEKRLNTLASNKTPEEKVINNIYSKSIFKTTETLNAEIKNNGNSFTKSDIDQRTTKLVDFCLNRWSL